MLYVATKIVFLTGLAILIPLHSAFAQPSPSGMAKGAFAEILVAADKNRDGNLSLEECYVIWKNKSTGEQQCKFWDKNSDGTITEEEYVAQTASLMK